MNQSNEEFVSRSQRLHGAQYHKKAARKRLTVGTVVRRVLLSIGTLLVCVLITAFGVCNVLLKSGCEPLKVRLVLSATQASAVKWLPGLFIPQAEVDQIVADSHVTNADVLSLEEYAALTHTDESDGTAKDKWADAVDGMILEVVRGTTFTGYLLQIKDPSRVFIGTASDYHSGQLGARIFDVASKVGAVAAINGGEFSDPGGMGTGDTPMGLTYSRGNCVWDDRLTRTFIGFDKNDRLIVRESMTRAKADELGIRDAVSFQNGNVLISGEGDSIEVYYSDSNTGTAQRTAVGQTADGTVLLLVTDGRSASSLGATRNDVIDLMVKYGAVSAAMLDGGSSSMMYYENYFDKYPTLFDRENLDEYQIKGLVNKYKAFTPPRRMPTFICVAAEEN